MVLCIAAFDKLTYCSWVQTEMGRGAATAVGMDDAPVTSEQSVTGLTKEVCNTNSVTLNP